MKIPKNKMMKAINTKLWMTAFVAILLAIFTTSCKDKNVEVIGVCPVVSSTDPASTAIGVPLDKVVTVTFNEKMNPLTITPATFILQEAAKSTETAKSSAVVLSGAMTYDASNFKMSFVPTATLKPNTLYSGTVKATVKDLMGNALQTDYVWTFTTSANLSPKVTVSDPANNATAVFLNKVVNATFNVPMDPTSITTSTFTLMNGILPVAGSVSYSGGTAFFAPTAALTASTVYTATISKGVKDATGTSMASDFVWTFTTGSVSAPKVNSTLPLNLATGVALNSAVSATFSEAMDPLKITSSTFTVMNGTTLVAGAVTYTGLVATFTPTANLLSGTTYTARITSGAQNPAGISLANDYVWTFNTISTLGPLGVDLKTVGHFGIIAGVGVTNAAGFSEIHDMDCGISPGVRSSFTGFPPAIIVNGSIFASDDIAPPGVPAMLIQAKQDLTDAYLFAEAASSPAPVTVAGDQGGKTLAPGIYKSTSTLLIQSGDLTLDAQGDANAVWIFQIASDFTTIGGAGGNVILTGGAQAKNVYWQTGRSATIGDYTNFKGTILALTSITMNSHATAQGRMLARNGAVVLTSTNIITKP
jgi:hypothetical protein